MKTMKDCIPDRKGEWMQVSSGGKFFPQDPSPEEVHIRDIANGLALTCRYGGQGKINKFYSVAEHSLHMANYALRKPCSENYRNLLAFCCLMHDAAEAYTGDLIRSMKSAVGDSFKLMEDNIQNVILRKYDILLSYLHMACDVKELDNRIIVNEKAALFDTSQEWAHDNLEPLGGVEIKCFNPWTAKNRWLDLFFTLKFKVDDDNRNPS